MFHTICNFLGIIGKRFLDAGLRYLAVESDVIAEGSVERVLNGQQYNRGVCLHKLLYEALKRLAWKGFLDWFQRNHTAEQQCLWNIVCQSSQSTTQENLDSVLHNPRLALLFDLFQQYLSFLRSDRGPLAQFWMSYIDMVETLITRNPSLIASRKPHVNQMELKKWLPDAIKKCKGSKTKSQFSLA